MKKRRFKVHVASPWKYSNSTLCGSWILTPSNRKKLEDLKCPVRITCQKCKNHWRFKNWLRNNIRAKVQAKPLAQLARAEQNIGVHNP